MSKKQKYSPAPLCILLFAAAFFSASCGKPPAADGSQARFAYSEPNAPAWIRPRTDERKDDRGLMVSRLSRTYRFENEQVLDAMAAVPRHWFVPPAFQSAAYADGPLPIGYGQTISQPYIVAYMTSQLNLDPNDRVLEIGTGSGYQAAVLNEFTPHVYTIEIVEELGSSATQTFEKYGYSSIEVKVGDGYEGWPQYAPFDAIIVTCAPDAIPKPLINQLRPGGRMIIPVGSRWGLQELVLVEKSPKGKITRQSKIPVSFVPMTRE